MEMGKPKVNSGINCSSISIIIISIFMLILTGCGAAALNPGGFKVLSISPADGSESVNVSTAININFSGDIDPVSANIYTLRVMELESHSLVEGKITHSTINNTLTFQPYMPLPYDTDFHVVVTDKIRNAQGRHVESSAEMYFTTAAAPHEFAVHPIDNETNVSVKSILRVQFEHETDMSTVNASSFTVYPQNAPQSVVAGEVEVDSDSFTAIFYPDDWFDYDTAYTIALGEAIQQSGTSAFSSIKTSTFTTANSDDTTAVIGTMWDDYAYALDRLNDGNLVAAGETWDELVAGGGGNGDAFISVYNPQGEEQWTLQFGGNHADAIYDMFTTGNNIYVTGYTDEATGGVDEDGLPNTRRGLLLRQYAHFNSSTSAPTSPTWSSPVISSSEGFVEAVAMTKSGTNIYVLARVNGDVSGQPAKGGSDVAVFSYTSTGSMNWVKVLGTAADEFPQNIVASDNSIYVVGDTLGDFSTPESTHVGLAPFMSRLSLDGSEITSYNLVIPALAGASEVNIVSSAVFNDGELYIGGVFRDSGNGIASFVSRINNTGQELTGSTAIIGAGTLNADERITAMYMDSSGQLYIGATYYHLPTGTGGMAGMHGGGSQYHGLSQIYRYNNGIVTQQGQNISAGMHVSIRGLVDSGGSLYMTGFLHGMLDGNMSHGMGDAFIRNVN